MSVSHDELHLEKRRSWNPNEKDTVIIVVAQRADIPGGISWRRRPRAARGAYLLRTYELIIGLILV